MNSTAEALEVFKNEKATDFLVQSKVLSREEIDSRYHIMVERYVKTLDIELDTLSELVQTFVIPTVEKQIGILAATHSHLTHAGLKKRHAGRFEQLQSSLDAILGYQHDLHRLLDDVRATHDETKKMQRLAHEVQPVALKLRESCDAAERLVSDDLWPLPKYREMLFTNSLS